MKIICRLCLTNTEQYIDFFDNEGLKLNAATIVAKHFWFEPQPDDILSDKVCQNCWTILDSFHALYLLVENAHNTLTLLKPEDDLDYLDPKSENESLNGNDFNSSEFLQDSINALCKDIDDEISEKKDVILITEHLILDPNEVDTTTQQETKLRGRRQKFDKNKDKPNESIDVREASPKEEDEHSNKKRKRGRPTIAEMKERQQNATSKPKKEKRQANEIVSDDEIAKMKRISCSICMNEIATFLDLKKHFQDVHNENGYAICCDKKFYKRYKFVHHLKMHVNPNEYKCPHCDKLLGSKKYIRLHIKNMHSEVGKVKSFACNECEKSFAQKGALSRHKLTHIPESEKQFPCDKCEKIFPSQGVLRTHKITVHEGRYGGICALCGKKYQNPQDLRRHCLEHEGKSEPKAQCDVCGDWLANKYKLKRHMIKHNTAHLEHRCHICNKTSPNQIALRSHIRFTHDDSNKIHQCNACEKSFRRKIDLREHMTVHTGEHLYSCPHCPRTFTHHSNMHHHRKKMHRREFDEERARRGLHKISWNKATELRKAEEDKVPAPALIVSDTVAMDTDTEEVINNVLEDTMNT